MHGQVDEKTAFIYIYNPNTEQENLSIMNEALIKSDKGLSGTSNSQVLKWVLIII
jgi:hypothetical protein